MPRPPTCSDRDEPKISESPKPKLAPVTKRVVASQRPVAKERTVIVSEPRARSSMGLRSAPASTVAARRANNITREDEEDDASRRRGNIIYMRPREEEITVVTPNGQFRIPNFELMNDIEVMRYLNSYRTKFMQMNEDWKHVGVTFDLPREGEEVSNVAVRYMEAEKHLSTRTGGDFWFIVLCIGWGFIQYTACEYGLPADGYVDSQIAMYKIYQSQLIRLGATSGFGTEWSPWMQVTVTSCANLLLLIILARAFPAAKGSAPMLMREISQAISGNTEVERSDQGTPKPNAGGLSSLLSGVMGGGGGAGGASADGFLGMISGMFGGGGSKKKRSKKQKKKDVAARRADDDDLDC
ncbi:Hypothetical protein POVR2_LOCUS328 [uncultured virus]|nr:Hypothetical protein POVR2_LOCUS328 [uncultured virus]